MNRGKLILILFFFFIPFRLAAQLNTPLDLKVQDFKTLALFKEIENQTEYLFNYNPADLEQSIFIPKKSSYTIEGILEILCDKNNLRYELNENSIFLISNSKQRPKNKNKQFYTIHGYIQDTLSQERLIGAHVVETNIAKGTNSNAFGFFSMHLPEGQAQLFISYIGYQDQNIPIHIYKDTTLIIQMHHDEYFEQIIIRSESKKASESSAMSKIDLSQKQLNINPTLFGENDVLKSLESLPGVHSSNNLQSGILVRGGSQDQNLILLDGVPLYNTAHVGGLYSIFNSDLIKQTSLSKGAFPARYGGRLSSVVDIRLNDGDLNQIHGNFALNLIASKFTLEGPLVKEKTSFILSGRRSYADILTRSLFNAEPNDTVAPTFNFHDINFKVQHILNKKHRLYFNVYSGNDAYGIREVKNNKSEDVLVAWSNNLIGARWNWEVSKKLFMHTNLSYLRFKQGINYSFEEFFPEGTQLTENDFKSQIQDYALRLHFDYIPNLKHFVRFGLEMQHHRYNPGDSKQGFVNPTVQLDTLIQRPEIKSQEINAYIEDDIHLGKLKLNLGLHSSAFLVSETIYPSLQARISSRYALTPNLSMKAAFSQMSQFNYYVTSNTNTFISDLWVTTTDRIKPQNSWQTVLGIVYSPASNYELSTELYYKKMKNVLTFRDGAEIIFSSFDPDWESSVVQGKGEAYGIEFFAKKNKGKINGWTSYTLARNLRQFEGINDGELFSDKYDIRHKFSITGTYSLKEGIQFSLHWHYLSGRFTTLPNINVPSKLIVNNPNIENPFINLADTAVNTRRNNHQFSDTHRLDISFDFIKRKKRYTRTWSLGVYNAYFAQDPLTIQERRNDNGEREFVELSILPILPSISYRIDF